MNFAEAASFFGSFIRHPRDVSSIIPTSRASACAIAATIRPQGRTVAVEYGPGSGPVSAAVLEVLAPGDRLILIEKVPELAAQLRARFASDPRVTVVCGSAADVATILEQCGESRAQVVLSSIPLSLMEPALRDSILAATAQVLGPEGLFLVFLFRPRATASYLAPRFPRTGPPRLLLWNIPPLWLFSARV